MNELYSFRKMYNGITNYFINIADNMTNFCDADIKIPIIPLKREEIINSLIATISFNIIFRKEQIVEKTEGVVYKSKLSDNDLDLMLNHVNAYNSRIVFEDSATMLAFIRNKLAHGDYHIDSKCNRLCFKRNTEDIFVDLKILIDFYVEYSESLTHRFKGRTFTKQIALNKGSLALKKPIETERELEQFLSLYKIKKYTFKKINGEDLTSKEKERFLYEIEKIKSVIMYNKNDEKVLDRELRDKYSKLGYVVDVSNSKIKDECLKDKIRRCIEIKNETAKANDFSMGPLIYFYGTDINKIINDYSTECIEKGLDINEFILKEMYYKGIYDYRKLIDQMSTQDRVYISGYFHEFYVAIALIRFYSLYCYPLESLFKNNKVYHMDRSQMFPFDKLDLSEFNPDVININKVGLTEASDKLRSIGKIISSKNERLNAMEKNIIGLSTKEILNDNELKKLNEFKDEVIKIKRELDQAYELYMETSLYYNYVKKDYESDYFKNKTIIEGMRDALSHANVKISNIGFSTNIKELGLEFNDMYEGNVEFNLKTNFYSLENLYEIHNVDVIDNYVNKMKF